MATEEIIIHIRAIDDATAQIQKVANTLKSLPALDFSNLKGVKQIDVINKSMTKLVDPVKAFQAEMNQMDVVPIERLDQTLKTAGLSANQFTAFLEKNNLELIKGVGVYDKLTGAVMTQGQAVRLATIQTRRFHFEYLGLLFAGLALERTFGGIVKAQLQLFGVSDLLSAAWTTVMLPIMQAITPVLFKLLEGFMSLPDPIKTIIGALVLLGFAAGAVIAFFGQLALAIFSFGLLGTGAIATVAGIVTGLGVIFVGVGSIIAGVVSILKGKLEGIGFVIMGIGVILALFLGPAGWIGLIVVAVGAAVALIIKHWETIKSWFVAFGSWLAGIFSTIWNGIKTGFQAVGDFFKNVWEGIKNVFKGVINFIISLMNGWISGFESMINFAIRGLNALIKLINKVPGIKIGTIGEINLPRIPSFQTGGIMPNNGLAFLHAGERVIPKNQVNSGVINFSPTITVNANVSSSYDVRQLASDLNSYWAQDFQRMMRSRGSV